MSKQNKKAKTSKILQILLAGIIAFGLWIYVVTVERTETEQTFYNVPVVLDGESVLEDRGLMLAGDSNPTVTLKLNGNRSDLNKLRSSDITVLVDLTRIYEAGEKDLNYTVSFPADVQNSAIEVVSRDPATITLTVAERLSKEIPLEAAPSGQPASGFELDMDGVQMVYNERNISTITVTGPKDIVEDIASAKLPADMSGKKESFEERVNVILCDADGQRIESDLSAVTPSPHNVKLTVPVLQQKQVELTVDVVEGNGLTEEDVQIELSYDTLLLAGRPAVMKDFKDRLSIGTINLGELTDLDNSENVAYYTFEVTLPDNVQISAQEPNDGTVEVTVTLQEYTSKSWNLDISETDIINVPTGKTAVLQNTKLRVTLEGRASVLDRLTADDFEVTVDAARGTSGQCKVTVTCSNPSVVIDEDRTDTKVTVILTQNSPTDN